MPFITPKLEGIGLILPTEAPSFCDISALSSIPIVVLTDTDEDSIERMSLLSAFEKFHARKLLQLERELQEPVFTNNLISFIGASPK
jgi:hypothetical protein